MSELVVVGFDDVFEADRVLTVLLRLEREHLIDLEDAVVAFRRPDGAVHVKQTISPPVLGAVSGLARGTIWGGLIGLLFFSPLAGLAVGAVAGAGIGAAAGTTLDYGIDDGVIQRIADQLKPDTSALFLLIEKAQPERVLDELRPFGGHVIRTSLSPEQEERLRQAVEKNAGVPAAA
ncbi:MAG: DUF1269 domain-containing protein [Bauldia sp.]